MRSSIILAINSIYTKSVKFHHRSAYRLSIIISIVTISRLSFVSVYNTICTKSTVIAYKICYEWLLYFGLPSVKPALNFNSAFISSYLIVSLALPDVLVLVCHQLPVPICRCSFLSLRFISLSLHINLYPFLNALSSIFCSSLISKCASQVQKTGLAFTHMAKSLIFIYLSFCMVFKLCWEEKC